MALGTTPRRSVRLGEGQYRSPGGDPRRPHLSGDVLYADEDGIVVLPAGSLLPGRAASPAPATVRRRTRTATGRVLLQAGERQRERGMPRPAPAVRPRARDVRAAAVVLVLVGVVAAMPRPGASRALPGLPVVTVLLRERDAAHGRRRGRRRTRRHHRALRSSSSGAAGGFVARLRRGRRARHDLRPERRRWHRAPAVCPVQASRLDLGLGRILVSGPPRAHRPSRASAPTGRRSDVRHGRYPDEQRRQHRRPRDRHLRRRRTDPRAGLRSTPAPSFVMRLTATGVPDPTFGTGRRGRARPRDARRPRARRGDRAHASD